MHKLLLILLSPACFAQEVEYLTYTNLYSTFSNEGEGYCVAGTSSTLTDFTLTQNILVLHTKKSELELNLYGNHVGCTFDHDDASDNIYGVEINYRINW